MNSRHIAMTAAIFVGPLLALAAQPAYAGAITLTGAVTVTQTGSDTLSTHGTGETLSNNNHTLTDSSLSQSLTLSTPDTYELFDITSGLSKSTVTVTFTGLSDGTSGTPSTTTFTGTLAALGNSLTLTSTDSTVTFADGDSLAISLADNLGTDLPINVTFDLTAPDPVPEPASLALLGTALAGFGLLRRRGKRA